MRIIERAKWDQTWTSMIGCIKSCSDVLGLDHPLEWIFGSSGHAFVLNSSGSFCPSGPTAWNKKRLFELCENVGIRTTRIFKEDGRDQEDAWNSIRKSIDSGRLSYAWELKCLEFSVICGYDDIGYYFKGPGSDDLDGPFDWKKLGKGMGLWVFTPELCPIQPHAKTVIDALEFVLELYTEPKKWTIFDAARTGKQAYQNWLSAMDTLDTMEYANDGKGNGIAYNVAVWSECRKNAVGFLELAKTRLSIASPQYEELLLCFRGVSDDLARVSSLFPFDSTVWDENARNKTLLQEMRVLVEDAMLEEEDGVKLIPPVIEAIKKQWKPTLAE